MYFFEPLSALHNRSCARWGKGLADFQSLGIAGKAVAAGASVSGFATGAAYGVVKTLGVTGYELYSQSFGEQRGHTFFDYVTKAPILQVMVSGGFAAGVGAALSHFGVHLPWNIVPTTFIAGALTYFGGQFTYYLARVVSLTAHAAAGNAMSWVKNQLHGDMTSGRRAPAKLHATAEPRALGTEARAASAKRRPTRCGTANLTRSNAPNQALDSEAR